MKIQDSYLVELANGTNAWLATGKPVPSDALMLEIRPMLIPDEGKVFRHKHTGTIVDSGFWIKNTNVDDWEEIDMPEEYKVFLENS